MREMQMYSSLRTRKKTTEDIIQMMGGLKDELKRIDVKSGNVDTRVTILSEEINAKFDLLFKALNINPNGYSGGTPGQPPGQSPLLTRAKTMRPGSAPSEKLTSTKNMSIEAFANFHRQESDKRHQSHNQSQGQGQGRPQLQHQGSRARMGSNDDNDSAGGSGGGSRPVSASAVRPGLQRTRTGSNVSLGSGDRGRPHSGQRGRRGSGAGGEGPSPGYGRTREGREITRVGFF